MIRHLFALLLAAAPVAGQAIPPGKVFGMTSEARMQLDTMAAQSVQAHKEASACVVRSAMIDSMYVIVAIAPARHVIKSDSISISTDGPLCESWQPSIHTHILDNGYLEQPSPIDYRTTATRGVFGFLVSVKRDYSWSMQAYP